VSADKAVATAGVLAAALLIGFYLIRAVSLDMPIFASDEYAFFIRGMFRGVDLFALDPMLQQNENQLYFAWLNRLLALGHFKVPGIVRIVHIFELIGVCALLYFAFADLLSRRARVWAALATLLLPTSVYALATMPETELTLLSAIIGYLIIRGAPKHPVASSCAIGVVAGLALLIKPHGVAWVPAVLAYLGAMALFARNDPPRARRLLIAMPCMLIAWYAAFVIGWRLSGAPLSFNPADALGLKFYGGILKGSEGAHLFNIAAGIALYSAAHLIVLLALFFPATLAFWRALKKAWRAEGQSRADGMTSAALYIGALIAANTAMVAYFTVSAGGGNPDEAFRVHGRYFGCILIFMPFMLFKGLEELDLRQARLASIAALVNYVLLYLVVIHNFKIFPWDYPELFAFFTAPNAYHWAYKSSAVVTGTALFAGAVVAYATTALRPQWFRPIMAVLLFAILLAGQAQTHRWLLAHLKLNQETLKTAQALGAIVDPSEPGAGVFVGDARYGPMSYALFKLANAPRVLVRPVDSPITDADVQGAKWVILSRPYRVAFAYRSAIRVNDFTLYPLAGASPAISMRPAVAWDGDPIRISLADPGAAFSVSGFNEAEPWGAIAAEPTSEIQLPVVISGKVRIKLFGWMPADAKKTLRVSLGDASAEVEMTDRGADYVLDLELKGASDRVRFQSDIVHPESSHRNLGVALARMQIERISDNP
jgi:hypothetical protein